MKTQKEQIKKHLLSKKSITPIQALNKFGCLRLAAVIYKLKDEGFKILTEMQYKGKKQFAKYRLV
jgi:Helix-turn-helix domain